MIELRAKRSFVGQPGESRRPDGMIVRGTMFRVADEARADRLCRSKRAERPAVEATKRGKAQAAALAQADGGKDEGKGTGKRGGKAKAAPSNKAKAAPSNKAEAEPENKAPAAPLDGQDGIPTGEGAAPSSSPAGEAQATSAKSSGTIPGASPIRGFDS